MFAPVINALRGLLRRPSDRPLQGRVVEPLEQRVLLDGMALRLDGPSSAYRANTASLQFSGSMTVEMSFYLSDIDTIRSSYLLRKGGSYELALTTYPGTDQLAFRVYNSGGAALQAVAGMTLTAGWHHIAATYWSNPDSYGPDFASLYLDGTMVQQQGGVFSLYNTSADVEIGPGYAGYIDEVRLSSVARYSGNFTAPTQPWTTDGNTRALWHFDESAGSTSFGDSSGYNNYLWGQNGARTGWPDNTPPTILPLSPVLPDPRTYPVSYFDIGFSEPVDLNTFNFQDLALTRDGTPVMLDGRLYPVQIGASTYRLYGLDAFTQLAGTYQLTVNCTNIRDQAGNYGVGSASDQWVMDTGPTVVDVIDVSPDPRTAAVSDIEVTFSEPVNLTTFTYADLTLTRDGDPVTLDAGITIDLVSGSTYRISGLSAFTNVAGQYVLSVSAAQVNDLSGLPGAGAASDAWVMENPPPTLGRISGVKWEDRDGDGVRDAGEPGVPGWTLFLDANGNGQLDSGERSTTTGPDGAYTFDDLAAGAYTVAEVQRTGWTQTAPAGSSGTPAVADANTVLLDHFNGATSGTAFGGPTYAAGLDGFGSAIALGPGKYVRYPVTAWHGSGPGSNSATQGTVEMWFKADVVGPLLDFNWYQTTSYPSSGHVLYFGGVYTPAPYYLVWNSELSTYPDRLAGSQNMATGVWTHLAVTWGPGASKLYVDGQVIASAAANVYPALVSTFYAYLNFWGTNSFQGLIDELHISRVRRSDAEILAHAARSSPGLRTVTLATGEAVNGQDFGSEPPVQGDADLNGILDSDDYFRIDQGFLSQGTKTGWDNGDFNYDNRIDVDDYFLIDTAYARSAHPLALSSPTPIQASAGVPASTTGGSDLFGDVLDDSPWQQTEHVF